MTNLKNVRYAMSVLAAIAAFGMVTEAKAQTETVDVSVTVSNLLTLTVVDNINFGTIVAFKDTAGPETATLRVLTTGLLAAPTTTGAPAVIAVLDNSLVTRGRILVEDGAETAVLNVNIPALGVVNPVSGGLTFTLGGFRTSWNGAAATDRTAGTPWTQIYADNAGAGSTLDIGATITTVAGGAQYTDGTYNGSFDVVFAY